MGDSEIRREIAAIPLGSRWLLRSEDIKMPFLVLTTSEPDCQVHCQAINPGTVAASFGFRGRNWLDCVEHGIITFESYNETIRQDW